MPLAVGRGGFDPITGRRPLVCIPTSPTDCAHPPSLARTTGMLDDIGGMAQLDLVGLELIDIEQLDRATAIADHIEVEIDHRH
jgi:hypothetical protein